MAVKLFIALMIVLNVAAVALETEPTINREWGDWLSRFEMFSVLVFSIEYLTRVWCSAENTHYGAGWRGRLRYMVTPLALLDLLAIAPAFLGFFVQIDTRLLRIIRLLRIFKLSRHLSTMNVLFTVIGREAGTLISAIAILVALIMLASAGMYLLEHEAQPEAFGSIPRAMWWASATLTTVGYGDVIPITVGGKVLGVIITILGVGMAALPAGIIASGFTQELNNRRENFDWYVRRSLADGTIDDRERHRLERQQEKLGLSRADALRIIHRAMRELKSSGTGKNTGYCPHCGQKL